MPLSKEAIQNRFPPPNRAQQISFGSRSQMSFSTISFSVLQGLSAELPSKPSSPTWILLLISVLFNGVSSFSSWLSPPFFFINNWFSYFPVSSVSCLHSLSLFCICGPLFQLPQCCLLLLFFLFDLYLSVPLVYLGKRGHCSPTCSRKAFTLFLAWAKTHSLPCLGSWMPLKSWQHRSQPKSYKRGIRLHTMDSLKALDIGKLLTIW